MLNRRNFFKKAALAGAGVAMIPDILHAAMPEAQNNTATSGMKLKNEAVILFQGDSITDVGRNKGREDKANDFDMLGKGYALYTASELLASHPDKNLQVYNRGISGNKVYQLQERWEKDCIALKPDVLSILIGVNDFWHTKTHGYTGTVETYADDYRKLLSETKNRFPDIHLLICEPFTIKGGNRVDDSWYPDFDAYRASAKALAKEFKAIFVPFQAVFDNALKKAPAAYWGADGVHPSIAGAWLMKNAWLKACGL
ncbi:MAG: SGNH/GDSL hydrolase family protein [Dysgonamonadaceae bacterium]|jgi:lysophospholipase L1-like esterase|nr:SGNH/GDSL hydrolase family protein [Dysgonamonadaceae bacterium]